MTRITVTAIGSTIGADVSGIDLRQPLDDATLAEVEEAWVNYLVLRFRGQELSDPELLAFSRFFGELDPPGPNPGGKPFLSEFPEINVISNVKINGKAIGNLGDGEAGWHSDMTYVESPPRGALLHALQIPESGGNNRCTLHRRDSFDPNAVRSTHRTQIKGLAVTAFGN